MISENPLATLLELQTSADNGVTWTPWFGSANSVSIQRGGSRRGASASVDVGTITATLVNTGDPLSDSRLKPNLPIRLVTRPVGDLTVYTPILFNGFETSNDFWSPGPQAQVTQNNVNARTGTMALRVGRTTASTGPTITTRSFSGLTIGVQYRMEAWWRGQANGLQSAPAISVSGIGSSTSNSWTGATYRQVVYSFVATATTHTAQLTHTITGAPSATSDTYAWWDDFQLSGPTPNPLYVPSVPVFTGRINDLATRYALNKRTGETTTYVTISGADAVAAHVNTTRYGAVSAGAVGYETWAVRINRLAGSSITAVNAPADDSPIVRYGI